MEPLHIGDRVRLRRDLSESTEVYTVVWLSSPYPHTENRNVNVEAASGDRFLLNERSLEKVTE